MVLYRLLGSEPDLKERLVPITLNSRDALYD